MTTWAPAGQPWTLVAWREDAPGYRVIRCAARRDEAQATQCGYEIDHPEDRFEILFRPSAGMNRHRSRLDY